MNRIFYHRKALLQRQAESLGYMPAGREELGMLDYVKGAGGAIFENMAASIVHGDNGMARMVAVLAGRASLPLGRVHELSMRVCQRDMPPVAVC